jgi:hypothetical protein
MSNDKDVRSSFLPAIKAHLRVTFLARGLSINAIADIVGANRATVRRWLDDREHAFIDIHSAILLFEHLNLPMTSMFPATPWMAGDAEGEQQLLLCYLSPSELAWALAVVTSARETFNQKSRRSRTA